MPSLFRIIHKSGVSPGTFAAIIFLACTSSLLAVLPPHFLGASVNAIVGHEVGSSVIAFSPIALLNRWLTWMVQTVSLDPLVLFLVLFFLFTLVYQVVRNFFAVFVSLFAAHFILYIRQQCFARIMIGILTGQHTTGLLL